MTSIGRHNTAVLETLPRFPGVSGRSVVDYCVRTIFFLLACLLACYSCGLRETASTLDVSFLSLPVTTPSLRTSSSQFPGVSGWLPTAAGLGLIPFIVAPLDNLVEEVSKLVVIGLVKLWDWALGPL